MNFIPGKTYDPAHLRQPPENWEELVDAGHPLATARGKAIMHLRPMFKGYGVTVYGYDIWMDDLGEWEPSNKGITNVSGLLDHVRERLRLAPIAVKDGKPLHIWDDIDFDFAGGGDAHRMHDWRLVTISTGKPFIKSILENDSRWRWPVE